VVTRIPGELVVQTPPYIFPTDEQQPLLWPALGGSWFVCKHLMGLVNNNRAQVRAEKQTPADGATLVVEGVREPSAKRAGFPRFKRRHMGCNQVQFPLVFSSAASQWGPHCAGGII